jgi:serine/threonine protein kinase
VPGLVDGASFGPYRIVAQLGRGGMASVYRAYEPVLDRYVALKVLPTEFISEAGFAQRFEREAKVIARLEHPNIIPIFNYGIEPAGRIPWMAMRLIAGGSLSSRLTDSRPPHDDIVTIISAVAEALQYAHGNGVIHRDVKPPNILLDESGGIYLADFGIARMVEGTSALTQAGMLTGTPQYMAPEQAVGGTVDHRCDIYALGVVAYQMLVGTVPFTADTPIAVLMKQVSDPVPVPAPDIVPEPMMRPVLKCMAKKPEDRWQSATDFARALRQGRAESDTTLQPLPTTPHGQVATAAPTPGSLSTRPTAVATEAPAIASPPTRRRASLTAVLSLVGAVSVASIFVGAWIILRPRPAPAGNTSSTVSEPSPAAAPAIPVLPGRAALAIDLEVVQAVGAVADVLFVQFDLDGRTVKELSLTFPPDLQPLQRASVILEGLSTGSHRLLVMVSSQRGMPADAVQSEEELSLIDGINRLPVHISFVGHDDSTIQFH